MGRTTAKLNCAEIAAHLRRSYKRGYDLYTKVVRNLGRIGCGTSWLFGYFTTGDGRSSLHQAHITHRWINIIISHIKDLMAPLKRLSIPKLELGASVLLTKLAKNVLITQNCQFHIFTYGPMQR